MSDDPREIEAKFTVDPDGRARLAELESVGDFRVVSRTTGEQDDLYFDTEDRLLAASGATVRVRRTAKQTAMTFKGRRLVSDRSGEEHIANRLEDEVEISPSYADDAVASPQLPIVPDLSPLERALTIVGGQPLLPVARLANRRTTVVLRNTAGSEAELALDECQGTRLSDGRVVEFGEVELEAKGIDGAQVQALADGLRIVAPGLQPSTITKLDRVLGDR